MCTDSELADAPRVSVIMTALSESRHLAGAVSSVFAQDYPGPLEVVVSVGPSRDGTLQLAKRLAAQYGRMRVVQNPTARTPAGLNLAIAATNPSSTIIVRTDGHAQLPPNYIRHAVAALQLTKAANVGGMMVPVGTTPFECAAARAMSTRIGLGSAPFHVGGAEGPAASVYLGVFQRAILTETGGFDERFARAQDWELNHRIRGLGGVVWFDPYLQVSYRPRPNLLRLARQFHASGAWRWQIIRSYPETVSVRYVAAPFTVAACSLAAVVLVIDAAILHNRALALAAGSIPALYVTFVLVGSAATRRGLDWRATVCYPAALATMHMSWGAGFLSGALADGVRAVAAFVRPPARKAANKRRYSTVRRP